MNDRGQIRDLILAAGLRDVTLDTVGILGSSSSAVDAATGMFTGTPTITAIRERGMEPAPLIAQLAATLAKVGGRALLRLPLQAIVVTASAGPPTESHGSSA